MTTYLFHSRLESQVPTLFKSDFQSHYVGQVGHKVRVLVILSLETTRPGRSRHEMFVLVVLVGVERRLEGGTP